MERGLLRAILAGAHDVHPKARHGELFATGGVELRNVGDLRRLAQELEELDPPQLDIGGVELRQRRVGELPRDLLHVLLDARGGRDRLFLLQAGECLPVFLIGEIDARTTGNEQRDRHERENQQQVLAKQAASDGRPRGDGVAARWRAGTACVDRSGHVHAIARGIAHRTDSRS